MDSKKREGSNTDAAAEKKRKIEDEQKALVETCEEICRIRQELEPFAQELDEIEMKIAREQLKVQKKFMPQLKPIYERRDKVIAEHGCVWGKLITIHPTLNEQCLIMPSEANYLVPMLKYVQLNDLIDDNGSYSLEFSFAPEASAIFTPTVWKKTVYLDDEGEILTEKSSCTEITFASEEIDPRVAIQLYKEELEKEKGEDADGYEDDKVYSVAGWFSTLDEEEAGMFGDVFRRELYPHPETLLDEVQWESSDDDDSYCEDSDCEHSDGDGSDSKEDKSDSCDTE